jgi:hypothetical protein
MFQAHEGIPLFSQQKEIAQLQASAAVQIMSSFFWDVTQGTLGGFLPTFRDNLFVPSSRSSSPRILLDP